MPASCATSILLVIRLGGIKPSALSFLRVWTHNSDSNIKQLVRFRPLPTRLQMETSKLGPANHVGRTLTGFALGKHPDPVQTDPLFVEITRFSGTTRNPLPSRMYPTEMG